MVRRCSEVYACGDWIYAENSDRGGGIHEVRVVTRSWRMCRFEYRESACGEIEVVRDEECE